jgi:hypothetical protein
VLQSIGQGHKNNNCDFATRQVLLVAEVCIDCDQHIKSGIRESQEFAVLFSKPACFLDCARFVATIDEIFFKRSQGTLVDQNLILVALRGSDVLPRSLQS